MNRWLIWLNVILVTVLILSACVTFEEIFVTDREKFPQRESPAIDYFDINSTIKTIVLWSSRYKQPNWRINLSKTAFNNCPEKRCQFVLKRDVVRENISQYDALLFHAPDYRTFYPIPDKRSPHQIYVFVSQGAPQPPHVRFLKRYDDLFNFTSEFLEYDLFR